MKTAITKDGPGRSAGRRTARATCAALALLACGCDQDLSRDYELSLRVSSEPGSAVAGARASTRGRALGVSDDHGVVAIALRGQEGDVVPIEVSCPAGQRSPPPVLVPLRRLGEGARPEFAAVCAPLTRSIVVALRAERGPDLPVVYLGRELARTDASGAAHLLLDVASQDVVELVLDTSERPELRPKSPVLRIQPGPQDAIAAMTQEFSAIQRRPAKAVTRRGPTRIE